MKSVSIHGTIFTSFLAAIFFLTVSSSEAKVLKVTCTPGKGLNASIIKLKPGDVLAVTGTCDENVVIPPQISGITIDGQATAIINGIDPTSTTLTNRGLNNTVKSLKVIGGTSGIQIQRGSSATIDSVVIDGVGGTGIVVNGGSFARIVSSTIQNNVNGNGISVTENSSAPGSVF